MQFVLKRNLFLGIIFCLLTGCGGSCGESNNAPVRRQSQALQEWKMGPFNTQGEAERYRRKLIQDNIEVSGVRGEGGMVSTLSNRRYYFHAWMPVE